MAAAARPFLFLALAALCAAASGGTAPARAAEPGAPPQGVDPDIFREFGREFGTVTPGGGARGRRSPDDGLVIGPGGVVRPPRNVERKPPPKPAPTLEEKQAEIRRALVPHAPLAQARRKTLDDLYAKLAAASDEREAKSVASLILAIWQRSASDTAALMMSRADAAVAAQDFPAALRMLDRLVELQPEWAEAWNRRATVRFLSGDLDGSMADVDRVLKLEPKHFAALNGLAMILQRSGSDKRALQVYRRAAAVYPHQPALEQTIEKLALEVEGQPI